MPVSFPAFDHIPLHNAPLKEVICQVRFPLILKIAQELPSEFQDAIRGRFPILQHDRTMAIGLSIAPNQPVQPSISPAIFRFLDKAETRMISLAPDFFALSTNAYTGWQTFVEDLKFVADAMIALYNIHYATRVGLRYINILDISNTKSKSFSDLLSILQPQLTTLLQTKEINEPFLGLTQIRTKHEGSVFSLQSGIVLKEENPDELSFVLDFDQYTEEGADLDADSLVKRCERYHSLAYNAFRWAIKPDKLNIFEPVQ